MGFLSTLAKVLKSKTVWGAVGSGAIIVGQAVPTVAQYVPSGTKLSVVLGLATAAFTIYGRIQAKQPLGPVIDQTIAQTVDAVHQLQISAPQAQPQTISGKVAQIAAVTAVVKALPAPAAH